MKMRELERRTGVNREVIRVYFREGLLPEPRRPKPNVADYEETHVRSILAIRHLQRERRIPLYQIRKALDGDAAALPSDASAFSHLESLLAARVGMDDDLVPVTSLLELNAWAEGDALSFESIGAIQIERRNKEMFVTRSDAQLIGIWGQMRAGGFNEANGFKPSVVAMYVEAARSMAVSEVGQFLSIVPGRIDEARAAELAQTALKLMLDFFGLLRMKAVLAEFKIQTSSHGDDPAGGER